MHLLPARIRIVRQKQLFSAAPLLIDDPFARAPQPYCPHQKKLASRTVAQLQLRTRDIFNFLQHVVVLGDVCQQLAF